MAKTEEFLFQNVAFRPTVDRTGVLGQFEHDKDIGTIVHWGAERVWEFLMQAWQIG